MSGEKCEAFCNDMFDATARSKEQRGRSKVLNRQLTHKLSESSLGPTGLSESTLSKSHL